MDGEQFDDLIRSTLRGVERRGIVRAGLGSLVVAVMTAIGLGGAEESEAKKKKKKKKKPSPPPSSPPSPPPSPPPAPVCKHVQEACSGDCCAGLTCGENFCGNAGTECCGELGASCTDPCDCCGAATTCGAGGTCECTGIVCGGECISAECCANTDCPGGQICDGGVCVCSSGFNCGDDCCQTGSEICKVDFTNPPVCQSGTCPTTDYCTDPNLYACEDGCACATSINNVKVCSSFEGAETCQPCSSDAQCGADKVCIPHDDTFCNFCTGVTGFCVPRSCPSSAGMSAATSGQTSAVIAGKLQGSERQAPQASERQVHQGNKRRHSHSTRQGAKRKGHRRS